MQQWTGCIAGALTRDEFEQALHRRWAHGHRDHRDPPRPHARRLGDRPRPQARGLRRHGQPERAGRLRAVSGSPAPRGRSSVAQRFAGRACEPGGSRRRAVSARRGVHVRPDVRPDPGGDPAPACDGVPGLAIPARRGVGGAWLAPTCVRLPRAGWRAGLIVGCLLAAGNLFQATALKQHERVDRGADHRALRCRHAAARLGPAPDSDEPCDVDRLGGLRGRSRAALGRRRGNAAGRRLGAARGGDLRRSHPGPGHAWPSHPPGRWRRCSSPSAASCSSPRRRSPAGWPCRTGSWSGARSRSRRSAAGRSPSSSRAGLSAAPRPARAAVILAGEPAFAALTGWLIAGDRISPTGWLGAAIMLAAVFYVASRSDANPASRVCCG